MSRAAILLQSWVRPHPGPWRADDAEHGSPGTASPAVLVVDDDERVRRLTARMLRSRNFVALEAGSAAEALERLAGHPEIRVVVTDIVMPGTHGVELAQTIRTHYPGCRVLLMTGYAPELLGRFGIQRQFPVLLKPFQSDDLVRHVRELLEQGH